MGSAVQLRTLAFRGRPTPGYDAAPATSSGRCAATCDDAGSASRAEVGAPHWADTRPAQVNNACEVGSLTDGDVTKASRSHQVRSFLSKPGTVIERRQGVAYDDRAVHTHVPR